MEISNSFTVDAPIEEAWELLTNIPEIAPCLPGAKLTDDTDGVYSGGIKIKVGPVTAEYKGSAEFVEKDEAARKVILTGKGRDTRGAGNAQALITAQMTAVGDKTQVDINTDLKVSGKVAQFGRGVMQDISTKLLGQFADCLEEKIAEPATIDGIAEASAAATVGDTANSNGAGVSSSMPSPPPMPDSAIPSTPVSKQTAPVDAPKPQHAATASTAADAASDDSDDDDNVLDLGDIGLGKVLAKQFGPAIGGVVGLGLVVWLFRRLSGRS